MEIGGWIYNCPLPPKLLHPLEFFDIPAMSLLMSKQFSPQNELGKPDTYYKMSWGKPIFHYRMTCQKPSSSFHPHQNPSTKCPAKIFQASWLQNDMRHPTLKRLILTRIMIYGGHVARLSVVVIGGGIQKLKSLQRIIQQLMTGIPFIDCLEVC